MLFPRKLKCLQFLLSHFVNKGFNQRKGKTDNKGNRARILGKRTVICISSVAHSCPTLCYAMDCSPPGFPVHQQLPDLTQTHVHRITIQVGHSFSSKEQASFNFMAAVTICSDFGAQKNSLTVCIVSPSICHEVMESDAMILVF